MRRLILSATMIAGALGPWATLGPALAQGAAPSCPDGIDRLGQRIAAFEAAAAQSPAAATPQEIGQLRALRQSAERAGQGGNEPACQTILGEAAALVRSIEKPRVVAADDLAKAKLHSPNGEEMGSISELVVDPTTGRVAYAVVELGGFLGLGQRNFPVPWSLVQATPNGDGFVLNVPKDRLTAAPQFTNSNRPDMSDRQWAMALHTYYGVQPYWIRDSAALAAAGLPAGAGGSPQVQQDVLRLSQEVDRLKRELAQARTLDDAAAQQKPAAPAAGSSGDASPAPAQGGSAPPSPSPSQPQ